MLDQRLRITFFTIHEILIGLIRYYIKLITEI